jgi:chromosome segregation ATPase
MTWAELATNAVLVALGGLLVEGFRAIIHRKNMNANTAKVFTDAAISLVEPLQSRVNHLETKLRLAEGRATHLQVQLDDAQDQVTSLTAALSDAHAELADLRGEMHPDV